MSALPAIPTRADVVIVGGGLAGLCAARRLLAHDLEVLVLEAGDDIGGRVRSDIVDGITLDRGFQLLNPAYPEARRMLDLEALDLRPLIAGVMVARGSHRYKLADPRRVPSWAAASATAPIATPWAKSGFALTALRAARASMEELRARPDVSARVALAGTDRHLMERVVRPFLTGVLLESELTTSRHFVDLALRSFVRGTPSLPAAGMGAIPGQLAAGLPPGVIALNTPVHEVRERQVRTGVGAIHCAAVIVATDPVTAGRLLPGLEIPAMRSVTTWYHLVDTETDPASLTDGRAVLVVDADTGAGPLVNTVVLTHAVPEYAPGRALVSSSALGVHDDPDTERAVRAHLARLHRAPAQRWELVGTYPIAGALPAMPSPLDTRRPVRLVEGLHVAGDHRDTSSLQGAMVSGRRAAEAVLFDLGLHRRIDAPSPEHTP